ncbi:phosphohydrolase [Pseudomonas sp. Leaf48]|uniref:HD domain-containing protein n=1 Tax=Pseudomonas sp. Leaf48 TaxID=1736221 RepID=UPI0007251416|nr:HD domain-containing protein [Pseudomonas sp. Leaf48]KQN51177.1 phosphohydrolase [Pseudomonas sp. Leaf48]
MMKLATFKRMQDSTQQDWDIIKPQAAKFFSALPERVLAHLQLLKGDFSGFPIDRYSHCLQSATLALKDGRDEEYVVCTLLHDIGDTLGSYNHPEVAAAILKPFVSEANLWMIEHHGIFQGHNFFHCLGMDRNMRDRFKEHPHYERTVEFIDKYDSPAFDPEGEIYPLSTFEPMVRRVMGAPRRSIYKAVVDAG